MVNANSGDSFAILATPCNPGEMGSKLCVLVIVPHNSSMIRRALPSVGSLRSGSPASTLLWLAPTPCRPSRRTSFPSLGGTVPCPSRMTRSVGTPPSSGFGKPVPNRQRHTETTGSPRFLGSPLGYMPCSKTPVGRRRQATGRLSCCLPHLLRRRLPRRVQFRGSITQPATMLSTLRSQGYPCTTQDSLPAGGQP